MLGAAAEIEAQFALRHLAGVRQSLLGLGARLQAPRLLEKNLRFDTPDKSLTQTGTVLRLRQDRTVHLTYKVPGPSPEVRQEIEFEVDNFGAARAFLEALGFESILYYEKYREVFSLELVDVMLDELPFGCFVEIEGHALSDIVETARRLALDWERRIPDSYPALFERLRTSLNLPFKDVTFANFSSQPRIMPEDIAVREATISPAPEGRP